MAFSSNSGVSIPTREEKKDDILPIILINGKIVAENLLTHINNSNKTLEKIVKEQDEWAIRNIGTQPYDTILSRK